MPSAIEEALKKLEGTHLAATSRGAAGSPTNSQHSSPPLENRPGPDNDADQSRYQSRHAVHGIYEAPEMSSGRPRAQTNVSSDRNSAIFGRQGLPAMPQPLMSPSPLTGAELALMANMPDDVIPNAIVVKNINFAIKTRGAFANHVGP